MKPLMIISTSSHNVQLTDELCQFVEQCVRDAFGPIGEDIESVDVRLEYVRNDQEHTSIKAVVRADLHQKSPVRAEISDDELYAVIRRGTAASARAAEQALQRSDKLDAHAMGAFRPFAVRHRAANV